MQVIGAATAQWEFQGSPFFSFGSTMSADGRVIIGDRVNLTNNQRVGFRWTEDEGFHDLILPGYARSRVHDVTPDGRWVLGTCEGPIDPANPNRALMLYGVDTGLLNLNDVLADQGLGDAFAGLTFNLNEGPFIAGDGLAIAGTVVHANDVREGWVIYLDPIAILPGDFNHDGTVDAADYIVWRKGFATGAYMQTDYDLWRAHFGRGAGSNSSIEAIPEPMSAAIALLALAGCSLWLRAGSCRSR
jgi:hypothetical protein